MYLFCSLNCCLPTVNLNAINVHYTHQHVFYIDFSCLKILVSRFGTSCLFCGKVWSHELKSLYTWLKSLLRFYVPFSKIKMTYLYDTEKTYCQLLIDMLSKDTVIKMIIEQLESSMSDTVFVIFTTKKSFIELSRVTFKTLPLL